MMDNSANVSDRAPLPDGWTQKKENGLVYIFNEDGKPVCGAYNSRRRTYDKSHPCKGSNRCRFHGGAAISGRSNKLINRLIQNVRC